jgi:hypothetical protein
VYLDTNSTYSSFAQVTYQFTAEQLCLLGLAQTSWKRRESAKRHRLFFGEESITETILMDLADRFPGQVHIVPFNKYREGQYGADWAWAFENADRSQVLPMLVQAKVLDINDYEYPEINRTIGKSKVRQINRFIATATKWEWPAVYAFYNHLDDESRIPNNCITLARAQSPIPSSWGISFADAYVVRAALDDQTFDTHRQHCRPLHCLLCSGGTGTRGPGGSPVMALQGLRALRETTLYDSERHYPPLPDTPFNALPEIFQLAREFEGATATQASPLVHLAKRHRNLAGVVMLRDAQPSR